MPSAYVDEVIEIIRNDPRKYDTAMQVANLLWWGAGINSKNIPRPNHEQIAEVLELATAIDNPGLIAMFEDEREILNEWEASGKKGTPPNKKWDNVRLGELLEFARMNPQMAGPQSAAEQAQVIRDVDAFVAKLEAKRRGQAMQGLAIVEQGKEGLGKGLRDPATIVGSFLSGEKGTLTQQMATLKNKATGMGGRRKTKTSKKKSRRTRRR
jgi:hypothetical protein